MSGFAVLVTTVALIALSAFFVAVEFAVLAARRHRLEDRASSSRAARAALRSVDELTLLLAGCQLGITASALGLGAVTKPAVKDALTPWIGGLGAPSWVASAGGFVLAIAVVTFLHLVIGEMAPKSWAIGHPERAAVALALPARAFMWLTRPLLRAMNATADWCLRRVGVDPRAGGPTGSTPADLRALVEHSANVGALDASFSAQVTDVLEAEQRTVGDLVDEPGRAVRVTSVPLTATAGDVREAARTSGHLRILLRDDDRLVAMVHVRDTLGRSDDERVAALRRDVLGLDASTSVSDALTAMRRSRTHLGVVPTSHGPAVITLDDVLATLLVAR